MLSIIIPYLSSSHCISLCKEKIAENTTEVFEIVEIVDCKDVYDAYNQGAKKAKYDILVFINDDMIVAPDWDKYILKYLKPTMVMTQYLVECGHLNVSPNNIEMDFGREIETFNYDAFCKFSKSIRVQECLPGFGWYMPFMIMKESFIPYPNNRKYPHANDITLFEAFRILEYSFVKINSFAYHFQGFSRRSWKSNDSMS